MGFDLFVCFPTALSQLALKLVCLLFSLERPSCSEFSPTTNYVGLCLLRYERAVPCLFLEQATCCSRKNINLIFTIFILNFITPDS